MLCPFCRVGDSRVISSREGAGYVRRRRSCPACEQRFTTHEYVTQPSPMVVKKDGRREPFDRTKLQHGMHVACAKRPVPSADIEAAVAGIESALFARGEAEIRSDEIGELVLAALGRLDAVAYIRFASVYRDFPDLATLQQAIAMLTDGEPHRQDPLPLVVSGQAATSQV